MLIGLGGVVALVGIDIGGERDELLGALAILVVAFRLRGRPDDREAAPLGRRPARPGGRVARHRGAARDAVRAGGPARLDARPPTRSPPSPCSASLCSALAFLLFFRLIAEVGPGRATVITYINPVVALALGVAILDESVTTGVVVGLLLILAGSWLSTDGRLPPGLAAAGGARARPRG